MAMCLHYTTACIHAWLVHHNVLYMMASWCIANASQYITHDSILVLVHHCKRDALVSEYSPHAVTLGQ